MRNDIQLLELLLKDQSLSLPNENTYISWATDDYCVTDEMGDNSPFAFNAQITPELISSHPDLIQPRIKKRERRTQMANIQATYRVSGKTLMDVVREGKTHGDNLRRRAVSYFAL